MQNAAAECLVIETHFVGDYSAAPVRIPSIGAENLNALIQRLLRTRTAVSPGDLFAFFGDGKPLPARGFMFTFDDGIRGQLTNAVPVLQRYGLSAAFYIPGSVFDPAGRLPLLERQRFLQYAYGDYREFLERFAAAVASIAPEVKESDLTPSAAALARMGAFLAEYPFYSVEERYYRYLRDKILSPDVFAEAIDRLFQARFGSDRALLDAYYFSAADVRDLSAQGMTVGCHGYAHEHLPRLPDQRIDIERGIETLTDIVGERPQTMSYPFGSYDARTLDLMRDLDMVFAFTTANQTATITRDQPFQIPRRDIAMLKS
jgi:peptidoglycan/xylan/chitin deacetylase (PgdA/CDA1 family)